MKLTEQQMLEILIEKTEMVDLKETLHSISIGPRSIQSRLIDKNNNVLSFVKMPLTDAKLYPKREWVGLTDDDLSDIADSCEWISDWRKVVNATEAKLKEKNV